MADLFAAGAPVLWDSESAARVTHGRSTGEWAAHGISIDTRTLKAGDLFVALRGVHADGHAYVAQAFAKGAAAAMVSEGGDSGGACLRVDDTLRGLEDLACAARSRAAQAHVVGVTGSVGKTSTKNMMAAAFAALYPEPWAVHASQASYNNHWGVPLSLATLPPQAKAGIFEMGMNHAGELSVLSGMVRPHSAVITKVASVHIEHFESEKAIAQAKGEIFSGMSPGGIAILNADDVWFSLLSGLARTAGLRILSFGIAPEADARLTAPRLQGALVQACVMGEALSFDLPLRGTHMALNALAVLLAVHAAGGCVRHAAQALAGVSPACGRGAWVRIFPQGRQAAHEPIVLIDESYNASPPAVRAALEVLGGVCPSAPEGRRILVLGDMYELGAQAADFHKDLRDSVEMAGVDLVFTSGSLARHLLDSLPSALRGGHADDTVALGAMVAGQVRGGDVVMVKGSRGGGTHPRMRYVVRALEALGDVQKCASNA